MKAKQKICLFGGTFDPIHLGHTYITEKCQRELNMDQMIFLPCKQSPHKLTKQSAPDDHRLEMCKLATSSFPWASVNDHDLTASPPSYSWRTAEYMKTQYPDAELYWLMGTDQWKSILKWDRAEYLSTLVKFIVVTRGETPASYPNLNYIELSGSHSASATLIRTQPVAPIAQAWLHPLVNAYIQKHHLY